MVHRETISLTGTGGGSISGLHSRDRKARLFFMTAGLRTNTTATVPKASNTSNFSTNTQVCSYYIEDGSFARLKNLQIGYTLPKALLK